MGRLFRVLSRFMSLADHSRNGGMRRDKKKKREKKRMCVCGRQAGGADARDVTYPSLSCESSISFVLRGSLA